MKFLGIKPSQRIRSEEREGHKTGRDKERIIRYGTPSDVTQLLEFQYCTSSRR